MARPIADTPVLTGRDAAKFEEAITSPTPVSKEEYENAYRDYQIISKIVAE